MKHLIPKIRSFFQFRDKNKIDIVDFNITILGEYGYKAELPIKDIRSIYLTEIDRITYIEEYIVFVGSKNEYFIPSYYNGYSNILDKLSLLGLKLKSNWEQDRKNVSGRDVITIYETSPTVIR